MPTLQDICWLALRGWLQPWNDDELAADEITTKAGKKTTWAAVIGQFCSVYEYGPQRPAAYVAGAFLSHCLARGLISDADRIRVIQGLDDLPLKEPREADERVERTHLRVVKER